MKDKYRCRFDEKYQYDIKSETRCDVYYFNCPLYKGFQENEKRRLMHSLDTILKNIKKENNER